MHFTYKGKIFVIGLLTEIFHFETIGEYNHYCGGDGKATYSKIEPQMDWIKEVLGDNYCDSEWVMNEKEPQINIFDEKIEDRKSVV